MPWASLGSSTICSQESDVVSLHLPLTPETDRLIDATRLAAMKPGAILVNTARGGLVDEPALIELLRQGHLGGAALDVFATEPLPADHPMLELPNVVLAPHVAWHTPETMARSWLWPSRIAVVLSPMCHYCIRSSDLCHRGD